MAYALLLQVADAILASTGEVAFMSALLAEQKLWEARLVVTPEWQARISNQQEPPKILSSKPELKPDSVAKVAK